MSEDKRVVSAARRRRYSSYCEETGTGTEIQTTPAESAEGSNL